MKKIEIYEIVSHVQIANDVYEMKLAGDGSWVHSPGQFINITIDNAYLKRPISLCDYSANQLTIIYKVVGFGTRQLSQRQVGQRCEALVDLGNGFNPHIEQQEVVLLGGGVGVPPLYGLCKELLQLGKQVHVILGFTSQADLFYEEEFKKLGVGVSISTNDGSAGTKGFVTDILKEKGWTGLPYFTCGPEAMLKAVHQTSHAEGQLSFEARMGCGFGACMGCSCQTLVGAKRICVEGPVMSSKEVTWNNVM